MRLTCPNQREFQVEAGTFFTSLEDLRQVVVGVHAGRPICLRDVAEKLEDAPAEANNYVLFANARGGSGQAVGAWIFASPAQAGTLPWSYDQVRRKYQAAAEASGIGGLGTHSLRLPNMA